MELVKATQQEQEMKHGELVRRFSKCIVVEVGIGVMPRKKVLQFNKNSSN